MRNAIDPNDIVDPAVAFAGKDYDPDEIRYGEWTLVPGDASHSVALIYSDTGVGDSTSKWGISISHGYHFSHDIPIHRNDVERALEELADDRDIESTEWGAKDWTYFE